MKGQNLVHLHSIGANVHAGDDIPFRWASGEGHLKIVKFLWSVGGVNVHAQDNHAMRWATANGQPEVIEFLKSLDCDATNLHHKTPDPMGPHGA